MNELSNIQDFSIAPEGFIKKWPFIFSERFNVFDVTARLLKSGVIKTRSVYKNHQSQSSRQRNIEENHYKTRYFEEYSQLIEQLLGIVCWNAFWIMIICCIVSIEISHSHLISPSIKDSMPLCILSSYFQKTPNLKNSYCSVWRPRNMGTGKKIIWCNCR